MDTNQQNNIYVNSFEKGMCTDVSYDRLQPSLYVFAENLRITANSLLGHSDTSNDKHGILAPVESGMNMRVLFDGDPVSDETLYNILATDSIDDVGVVIAKTEDLHWVLYKVNIVGDTMNFHKMYRSSEEFTHDKVSIVLNKERNDIIRLYVAFGDDEHPTPIRSFNLCDDDAFFESIRSDEELSSYVMFPNECPRILDFIGGRLKTQQVQYCYRFYKKHGNVTKLSPKTVKIQIINESKSAEEGCAEDTYTNVGVQLGITRKYEIFDSVQIFRLSYIKQNQQAEVHLIYDGKMDCDPGQQFTFSDTGMNPLLQLSTEELFAMEGSVMCPQVIDKNQGYLFAANIQDQTSLYFDCKNINAISRSYTYAGNGYWYKDGSFTEFTQNDRDYDYVVNDYSDINRFVFPSDLRNWLIYNTEGLIGGTGPVVNWKLVAYDLNTQKGHYVTCGQDYFELEQEFSMDLYLSLLNIDILPGRTYENKITSSIFRSLSRGETYRYGIVFYDKNGRRSEPKWVADISIPREKYLPFSGMFYNGSKIKGPLSLGLVFEVSNESNIMQFVSGFEIVRCQKEYHNSRNLYSGMLAKPVQQYIAGYSLNKFSPYYPTGFLTTDSLYITNGYSNKVDDKGIPTPSTDRTYKLFLFFCPEMQVIRTDAMNVLSGSDKLLQFESYFLNANRNTIQEKLRELFVNVVIGETEWNATFLDYTAMPDFSKDLSRFFITSNKSDHVLDLKLTENIQIPIDAQGKLIESIKDVKNPQWFEGFSNILTEGGQITGGIMQYKSFNTNMNELLYVNWVSTGMYDMKIGISEQPSVETQSKFVGVYTDAKNRLRSIQSHGPIGPGPQCFLVELKDGLSPDYPLDSRALLSDRFGSVYANIIHTASQFAGYTKDEHKYDTYCGYGFLNHDLSQDAKVFVFDGDRYIVPCQYVTLYKAYDFLSVEDSLLSTQIVNTVTHETSINTYFDYGLNYRNTNSSNLMLEPGSIEGIATQSRPEHQYNMVYSDNQTSCDVYNYFDVEDTANIYSQRIMYSEYKTDGEDIDSFLSFKPAQFLDVDTSYGPITQIRTVLNILYFWQQKAFGRLSVNEKSLVKDQNSNDIMLGQSGILQRHDYLSTTYGMREKDFSDTSIEGRVFWTDFDNKAILTTNENSVVDLGAQCGVQNLINERLTGSQQSIEDVQHNEIMFDCFSTDQQLVFNYQLNVFTSVYDRCLDSYISFGNKLFTMKCDDVDLHIQQINYIDETSKLLHPTTLKFVVNGQDTKTFDTQEIVTENHGNVAYSNEGAQRFMADKRFTFETNITSSEGAASVSEELKITDREGNIKYTIPRYGNSNYGNRVRGKWMLTTFYDNAPTADYTISRVHTKFRTSFS